MNLKLYTRAQQIAIKLARAAEEHGITFEEMLRLCFDQMEQDGTLDCLRRGDYHPELSEPDH